MSGLVTNTELILQIKSVCWQSW